MCWCVCPCLIHVLVCVSVFYTCVGMCDGSAAAHSGRAPSTGNPAHIAGDVTHVSVCVSMFGICVGVCDRSAVAHSGRVPGTGNPAHIAGDFTHVSVCVSMFDACVGVCVCVLYMCWCV